MPVNLISEGQVQNAVGDFVDVYQITYTVPGNDAPLIVNVPKTADALAEATTEIEALTAFVTGVKALP